MPKAGTSQCQNWQVLGFNHQTTEEARLTAQAQKRTSQCPVENYATKITTVQRVDLITIFGDLMDLNKLKNQYLLYDVYAILHSFLGQRLCEVTQKNCYL